AAVAQRPSGVPRRREPVEEHGEAGTVGRPDAPAVDLDGTRAVAERRESQRARGARAREGERPVRREAPVAGALETKRRLRRAHLLCCLPIDSGFSPAFRRLMTASIPSFSICGPKSSR